jgi:hypothetical protein
MNLDQHLIILIFYFDANLFRLAMLNRIHHQVPEQL